MDYKKAGVDIEAGYLSVELMKEHTARTMRPEVLSDLGGFSAAFSLMAAKGMQEPVLLSCADGVGTKLKIAFLLNRHNTVGIDCVAMCVNDLACAGAEPLFFLDYICCGKNYPDKVASIVSGIAEGCRQAGAALIGGETAEHPNLMPEEEYDLAGFAVGIADKKNLIDGSGIRVGDVLIGLASSGVHSNGFSLIRKIFPMTRDALNTYYPQLQTTLGRELLKPTRIYVQTIRALRDRGIALLGCSHITGGGFYENVPRMLPEGLTGYIRRGSYPIPPIFSMIAQKGDVTEEEMYSTYNMGIGMVMTVSAADADAAMDVLRQAGETPYVIGEVIEGEKGLEME